MSAAEIIAQVRSLPPNERLEIAEQIWAELGDGMETPDMLAELDRRAEEFIKNPSDTVPWEQVRADVRRRFGWQ